MMDIKRLAEELEAILLSVDRIRLSDFIKSLKEDLSLQDMVEELIYPVLEHIGELWADDKIALSQVYMSGRLVKELLAEFYPESKSPRKNHTKVALAVLEDYHGLGLDIIESFLKTYGIHPKVYGLGVSAGDLVDKIQEDMVDVLLVSTLMYRASLKVEDLVKGIKKKNLRVKVIVGGAPFRYDESLWKKVGADAFGRNAFESIELIKQMSVEQR